MGQPYSQEPSKSLGFHPKPASVPAHPSNLFSELHVWSSLVFDDDDDVTVSKAWLVLNPQLSTQ